MELSRKFVHAMLRWYITHRFFLAILAGTWHTKFLGIYIINMDMYVKNAV